MKIKVVNIKETLFQGSLIVALILLTVFSCNQYQDKKELKKEINNTSEFLQDTVFYYENKKGEWVATKKSLAGDKDQLEVLLSIYIDSTEQLKGLVKKYKKVAAAGNIKTVTKIDSVFIPFDRSIEFDFSRKFKVDNPWYSITGRVHRSGLDVDNLTVFNQMSFVLGVRKNGWFKPKTYSIDVLNSNPFIKTTGVDSYQFTEDIKRWSIGPYVGFDPFNQSLSGGVSLQYGLIRF